MPDTVDMDRVVRLTEELRAMGCAVAVFTPGDVEAGAEFLAGNRKYVEEAMVSAGNTALEAL